MENKERQELISTAIQKFSITDQALAEFDKLKELTIAGIDDKEGLQKVHDSRMLVKKKKIEVENKRVDLKEDALRIGQAIDKEAKRIKDRLESVEKDLEDKELAIKREKEDIENRKRMEIQNRLQARVRGLFENGMSFNGESYNLADMHISEGALGMMTDEQYTDYLERLKPLHEAAKLADANRKAEEQKQHERQRIEQQQLDAQRKEQEQKEQALKEQEQKIKTEREAFLRTRAKQRQASVLAIGLVPDTVFALFYYNPKPIGGPLNDKISIDFKSLMEFEEDEWGALFATACKKVEARKLVEEEAARTQVEKEKQQAIQTAIDQQNEAKIKAEEEHKRLAELAPDKEKLRAIVTHLTSMPAQVLKSKAARDVYARVKGELQIVIDNANIYINRMK